MTSPRGARTLIPVFIGAMLVALPGFSIAQEDAQGTQEDMSAVSAVLEQEGSEEVLPAGQVSCFDYYSFGSVNANLHVAGPVAFSGATASFAGTLENANPYPIVDGALYVKVFRLRDGENDGNGPDVVDQFLVKGDIVIPAQGSVPVSFDWRVPSYAVAGDYELATYFTTSRKFNLLGLTFTDDVVGNTVPFRVSGEQDAGVMFDKAGVRIDGEPYYFAAFPPRISGGAPVEVVARVVNTTDAEQTASIEWGAYQWDAQLREDVVQEELTTVTIPARGSRDVKISVRDARFPVYLVTASLAWRDTHSFIGARFTRDDVDRPRINFPGIMAFPLVAGQENTLFSCLHNTREGGVVPDGKLMLTLTDASGKTIHEYTYEGAVADAMMGVASAFTPDRSYDVFTLTARLYQGDTFIDEATLLYDCRQIDPALCASGADAGVGDVFILEPVSFIAALFFILIVLLGILSAMRRFNAAPRHDQPSSL